MPEQQTPPGWPHYRWFTAWSGRVSHATPVNENPGSCSRNTACRKQFVENPRNRADRRCGECVRVVSAPEDGHKIGTSREKRDHARQY